MKADRLWGDNIHQATAFGGGVLTFCVFIPIQLTIEFNNKTNYPFTVKKLESIFEKTIRVGEVAQLTDTDIEISVAFVTEKEIQEINRQYRTKNKPTDVLSFAEYERAEMIAKVQKKVFLGQLIVCPEYVKKSADSREIFFDDEITYVLSHGLLHLLGFSHGKKMYAIQQKVVDMLIEKKQKKCKKNCKNLREV